MPKVRFSGAAQAATVAEQDYLKAIYQLGGARADVATSDLAVRLDLTAGSVSAMLRKLDDQGFVSHARYRGVRLTKRGTREAVEMIRHHRLLELYLAKVVGMPWDKVHAEAIGEAGGRDLVARAAELVDRLEVVLLGDRRGGSRASDGQFWHAKLYRLASR